MFAGGAGEHHGVQPVQGCGQRPDPLAGLVTEQLDRLGRPRVGGLPGEQVAHVRADVRHPEEARPAGHQIARQLGARVVATAGESNHAFLRALGAETVIDYLTEEVVKAVRARYPGAVDKALNGVDGARANEAVRALRDGGRMVDLTGSASLERPGVRVETDYVVRADAARLARLARLIDDRQLAVEVQEVIPFEDVPRALAVIRTKHVRGKIVLEIA